MYTNSDTVRLISDSSLRDLCTDCSLWIAGFMMIMSHLCILMQEQPLTSLSVKLIREADILRISSGNICLIITMHRCLCLILRLILHRAGRSRSVTGLLHIRHHLRMNRLRTLLRVRLHLRNIRKSQAHRKNLRRYLCFQYQILRRKQHRCILMRMRAMV